MSSGNNNPSGIDQSKSSNQTAYDFLHYINIGSNAGNFINFQNAYGAKLEKSSFLIGIY